MVNSQGEINNHFYSYNIGPAHIISFSTEFYYYTQWGTHQILRQFEWLENDLIEATKEENRKKHPWIITIGHRPMYCNTYDEECSNYETVVSLQNKTLFVSLHHILCKFHNQLMIYSLEKELILILNI